MFYRPRLIYRGPVTIRRKTNTDSYSFGPCEKMQGTSSLYFDLYRLFFCIRDTMEVYLVDGCHIIPTNREVRFTLHTPSGAFKNIFIFLPTPNKILLLFILIIEEVHYFFYNFIIKIFKSRIIINSFPP